MISYTKFLNAVYLLNPNRKSGLREHLGFYATDCLHFTKREQKIRADSLRRATVVRKSDESLSLSPSARSKESAIYRQIGDFYESRRALVAAIDAIFE